MAMTYKDAGVNIKLGDDASEVLYKAAKLTWENRKGRLGEIVEPFDDFSGVRAVDVGGLPKGTYMSMGFDGVGTKMELAERTGKHDTVAYDLFAMVCDDAVVRGAEPVMVGSILDVNSLGDDEESHLDLVKELGVGYVNVASDANVAVINGEIAELGARVSGYREPDKVRKRFGKALKYLLTGDFELGGGFNYNWGAGVVWFASKEKMLTGYDISNGNALVAFREFGPRSNGLSLIRKINQNAYGRDWHEVEINGKKLGDMVLMPSRIYTAALVEMFGGIDKEPEAHIGGVAHITGGGIPGKLGRMLKPSGLGADIYNPFEPPELFLHCQDKGGVSDEEVCRTLNMGHGMIVATESPGMVKKVAERHGIEAEVIGQVTSKPVISIKNMGLNSGKQRTLSFPIEKA